MFEVEIIQVRHTEADKANSYVYYFHFENDDCHSLDELKIIHDSLERFLNNVKED